MLEQIVLGWPGKALLTSLGVALLLRLMQRCGPRAGGLITGLPIVTAPALLWLAASQGDAFAALAGAGSVAAGALCALFGFAYARASRHNGPAAALLAASALALLPVVLLVQHEPGLGLLLVGSVAVSLACVAGLRPAGAVRGARRAACSPSHVAVTATLAGAVSGIVGLLAGDLGAFWSGAVAAAPLIAAVVGVRLHLDDGQPAVQGFMRAYCVGLIARSVLTAVFCLLVPALGALLAMLVACIAVGAGWALLLAWRSGRAAVGTPHDSLFGASGSQQAQRAST